MKMRLWLRDADGVGWHVMCMYGSLFRDGFDGPQVFCIVIKIGRQSRIWLMTLGGRLDVC